jgi:hypothetical protein
MKFEHSLDVRPALVTVALTVTLSAVASATIAAAPIGSTRTGGEAEQDRGQVAVARPATKFRSRYQLQLLQARDLLAA